MARMRKIILYRMHVGKQSSMIAGVLLIVCSYVGSMGRKGAIIYCIQVGKQQIKSGGVLLIVWICLVSGINN